MMCDLIRQHLAAIQAEEQRAQQALSLAQQQVQELSVACLKLAGAREALELVLGTVHGGKDRVTYNGDGGEIPCPTEIDQVRPMT